MISNFSSFVFKKRKENKKSLQAIANQVAVSKPYIYDIEKGNNNPPVDYKKLNEWAKALSLTTEEREILFDLAVESRDAVPSDVTEAILNNQNIKIVIRAIEKGLLPMTIWEELAVKAKKEMGDAR